MQSNTCFRPILLLTHTVPLDVCLSALIECVWLVGVSSIHSPTISKSLNKRGEEWGRRGEERKGVDEKGHSFNQQGGAVKSVGIERWEEEETGDGTVIVCDVDIGCGTSTESTINRHRWAPFPIIASVHRANLSRLPV